MTPVRTQGGGVGDARNRRLVAQKYLEVGELAAVEEGPAANNVVVGICALAAIAAGDAICLSATGQRYAGQDHAEAARFLGRVDTDAGKQLGILVRLKPLAHHGTGFVTDEDRSRALRAATALVDAATARTTGG